MRRVLTILPCVILAMGVAGAALAGADLQPLVPDIPAKEVRRTDYGDYTRREVMIPMRDGVKLFTEIVIPKNAKEAPILLTRTPYNAAKRLSRTLSTSVAAVVPQADEIFVEDGYIRVFQDVRGKHGSEGEYVMNRPPIGPLNPTKTDHTTDTWDTIDWLVKNLPESNGHVAMIGSSYEGFTVLMGLLDPHPALKAAVPESPMVDGWMGDDWFHNGAFREVNLDYFAEQTTVRGEGDSLPRTADDDYTAYLQAGTPTEYARAGGIERFPFWQKILAHPAYDEFWQAQAVDRMLADKTLSIPVMQVVGAWDQEDIYGAWHVFAALEKHNHDKDRNFLVVGPWRHSGVNYDGTTLGKLRFVGDTALEFRRDTLKPFLDYYLRGRGSKPNLAPVLAYDAGTDHWRRFKSWPASCASGCGASARALYLQPGFGLDFASPGGTGVPFDEYIADPAKPVPFLPRPIDMSDPDVWKPWLVHDQRFVADRTDVLDYVGPPLAAPITIAGVPKVDLTASTSGSDTDWVVKLIDVYPDIVPSRHEMGGFQLMVSADIFRGRYRQSFEHPAPLAPNQPLAYRFDLPNVVHTFPAGHRIMVQIQSSWFPLYDRNPQTYVDNIFFAKPEDYRKATIRVYHAPGAASSIELPVVAGEP